MRTRTPFVILCSKNKCMQSQHNVNSLFNARLVLSFVFLVWLTGHVSCSCVRTFLGSVAYAGLVLGFYVEIDVSLDAFCIQQHLRNHCRCACNRMADSFMCGHDSCYNQSFIVEVANHVIHQTTGICNFLHSPRELGIAFSEPKCQPFASVRSSRWCWY